MQYCDDDAMRHKMREVGFMIAYHRRKKGLSQAKLAEAAGISRQHLAAVEAANMLRPFSVEFLIKIADVLEISPAEFFEFSKKS
ncbi:MAG: helix-turn-helix transcriptional regulator [Oscillospiraceae bacterium]|mgnify:CR=1 FL=1|nr:helix-turn-helix transcriptional regulator [Oscillospiraceae bacterium]